MKLIIVKINLILTPALVQSLFDLGMAIETRQVHKRFVNYLKHYYFGTTCYTVFGQFSLYLEGLDYILSHAKTRDKIKSKSRKFLSKNLKHC